MKIAYRKKLESQQLLLNHITRNVKYTLESIAQSKVLKPSDTTRYIKSKVRGRKIYLPPSKADGKGFPAVYTQLLSNDGNNGFKNTFSEGKLGIAFIINKRILLNKAFIACMFNSYGDCIYDKLKTLIIVNKIIINGKC